MDPLEMALNVAEKLLLAVPRDERTDDKIRAMAEQAAQMLAAAGPVDVEQLRRRLEARFEVWVPREIAVSDLGAYEHEPWYAARKGKIEFEYWRRYQTWLEGQPNWRPPAIEALDEASDRLLDWIEDPDRPGPWDVRGMVYGQVQSGKTASYTAATCKAVDSGYQVVIVLTGLHESLRNQTQARLDLEFLGFNSRVTRQPSVAQGLGQIGVGTLGMRNPPTCISVTSTEQDFTARVFESTAIDLRRVRLLVVAKKNTSILANLTTWLRNFSDNTRDGRSVITDAPLLLIDDEADYASIDTTKVKKGSNHSGPDHDPTKINAAIRGLLELFDKRVYLGYTATPFGNIFIPHDTEHPDHGKDLFPYSFILALRPPSNYCGPETVFGLEDPAADDVRDPLPVVRLVDDTDIWMPDKHKKGFRPPTDLPASLVEAIDAFVLATAVRKVRAGLPNGRDGHNSMLVHVTRWTDTQATVVEQIRRHLQSMRDTWGERGRAGADLRRRLQTLWANDVEATYAELASRSDILDSVGVRVEFDRVLEEVGAVLAAASDNVKAINGTAADVLDYRSSIPVTVIAVGGDKLSRGLTLEGLTVSYYLRASRTYDTLLQMGRWFGYRPGYLDVTRLYTSQDLVNYYVHVTRANRDLIDVVSAVAEQGQRPVDVGLRVLDGYGALQVTAAVKMRNATPLTFTFSGVRAETLSMRTDQAAITRNLAQLDALVEAAAGCPEVPLERRKEAGNGFFRERVPADAVVEFLRGYAASERVLQASPEQLVKYIEAQTAKGELVRWTVAVTTGQAKRTVTIDGQELRRVQRRHSTKTSVGRRAELADPHEVGVLVSPAHEAIGLAPEQVEVALEATRTEFRRSGNSRQPARASGKALRRRRDPAEGLLLVYPVDPGDDIECPDAIVGYAVVFPNSDTAQHLRYRANKVFIDRLVQSMRADEAGDEDEDDTE